MSSQINSNDTKIIETKKNSISELQCFVEKEKQSLNHGDVFDPSPDIEKDTLCGIGCFRPRWLQQWATPRTFLIFFSIVGVLQGSYYTYLSSVITTLEKRYAFKTKISGTIMMVDEITPLFLGFFVGYFGGKAHRPRMVAAGMYLTALCCLITSLPYFIYGSSNHLSVNAMNNGTNRESCDTTQSRDAQCDADDRPPTLVAVACLLFGSFVKGFGSLAFFAVGMSYMDDTAKKTNTPIYLAICTSFRLFGPTLGFFMSSAFLNYYENPFEDPGFSTKDPHWIGAWWIGFVLQAILLSIFTFPILLFPRRMPQQGHATGTEGEENAKEKISGMFKALKRLAFNPLYVLFITGVICNATGGIGVFSYLPKYMENQFHISASTASLLSGPPSLVAIQICTIIGGVLIWKLKPGALLISVIIFLTGFLDFVSYSLLMIPTCQQITMTGASITENGLILENSCNLNCSCSMDVFAPVCGPDGVSNYFSPCHAGCTVIKETEPEKYFNCSCIVDPTGNFIYADFVNRGYCHDDHCWLQAIIYSVIMAVTSGITSFSRVAFPLVLFRCVDPMDKSVALGTFEALLSGFALMPQPVISGSLADMSCMIWETKCGETGNCWLYDVDKFNYRLHGVSAAYAAVSAIFYLAVVILRNRLGNLYEEDEHFATKTIKIDEKPLEMVGKKHSYASSEF